QWLEQVAKPKVRPSTYARYSGIVERHLVPAIGSVPLDKLTPRHVQSMLNAKARDGMAPRGVHHLRAVLRTALNKGAVRWGDVPRNVARLTDSPTLEETHPVVLDASQAARLLAAAAGQSHALYAVAVTMGLRQGEALGLRWQDVDLDKR